MQRGKSELDVKFLGRLVRYEVRKGNDSQPQRILIRGDGFTCTYDKELRSVYLTTKPSNEILGLEFDVCLGNVGPKQSIA